MTTTDHRPEIAASWARSAQSGVRPEQADPRPADDVAIGGRLATLAQPVLDRLGGHLTDAQATLVLTDARARVLDRRSGASELSHLLDDVGLVPGHSYAEDAMGTNGMGTAAEERRPVTVIGEEHYAEALRGLTCVGVPIVNPVSGRLEGVVDLTCLNADAGRWMTPLALEAAHAVEKELGDAATRTEQALLAAFVARSRGTTSPIVAVTADMVLTNPAAARLLVPDDHQRLWEVVAGLGRHEIATAVALADGSSVLARFAPLEVASNTAGAVIALEQIDRHRASGSRRPGPARRSGSSARATRATGASAGPGPDGSGTPNAESPTGSAGPRVDTLVGSDAAWLRARRELTAAYQAGSSVLLDGPSGSGKLSLARSVAGPATVIDASRAVLDGPATWLATVAGALDQATPLILRRVDVLDTATALGLASLLSSTGQPTVATVAGPAEPSLMHGFGAVVSVPGLETRLDDLPELARALLRRILPSEEPSIAPEALQALMRAPWPGQVRQLDQVLRRAVGQRTQGRILLNDLPTSVRAAAHRRQLTPREQRDCQAITEALADTDGNKLLAAERLGVSRSTLYRKMSAFGLDLDRRAY